MKKEFFDAMDAVMVDNPNVYLIFVGLGYPRTQEFIDKYPNRAINTEASEQTALDIAVGLAYNAKIPVVYTITPFFWRGAETIRTYINHEKLNVKLVGAGRDDDYSKDDGFSHYAGDDKSLLDCFKNIFCVWPTVKEQIPDLVEAMVENNKPWYINLTR